MADNSAIEWTNATWNPITGCTKVSLGCDHCYAETFAERWRGTPGHPYEQGFDLTLRPERLDIPIRWTRPRRIFVNSMSDLFHKDITDEFIARVFSVMAATPRHTFQVLTKRHGRMRSLLSNPRWWQYEFAAACRDVGVDDYASAGTWQGDVCALPNVWLGTSVENQKWADIRIPALLATPAAVRWISAEPLLGPLDLLDPYLIPSVDCPCERGEQYCDPTLDWVVVGGESGPGARPMDPDWARVIRRHCSEASTPFLFKQWGAHDSTGKRVGKKAAGRMLDGRTYDGYPQVTVHA